MKDVRKRGDLKRKEGIHPMPLTVEEALKIAIRDGFDLVTLNVIERLKGKAVVYTAG